MRIGPRQQERRQARNQLAGLGVAACIVLALIIRLKQVPADAVELRIRVADLRSHAAELTGIEADAAAGNLHPAFVREHLRELARINGDSFRELARLRVDRNLEPEKTRTLADARELTAHIAAAASGQPVPQATVQDIRNRLQNRERGLPR
jgi:hypothetical protein